MGLRISDGRPPQPSAHDEKQNAMGEDATSDSTGVDGVDGVHHRNGNAGEELLSIPTSAHN